MAEHTSVFTIDPYTKIAMLEQENMRLKQQLKELPEKFAEMLKEKCKMDDNPLGLNVFLIDGTIIDEICKEITEVQ